jgi:hypothetical protein
MKPLPEQFAQDVQNGVVPAGNDISVLCCAHNEDRRQETDPLFPFRFDESSAHAALNAIKHLQPSHAESFFLWRGFGWRTKATGARRYAQEAF